MKAGVVAGGNGALPSLPELRTAPPPADRRVEGGAEAGLGLAASKSLPELGTGGRGTRDGGRGDYANISQPAEGRVLTSPAVASGDGKSGGARPAAATEAGENARPNTLGVVANLKVKAAQNSKTKAWCTDKRERQKQIVRDQVRRKKAREAKVIREANVLLVEQHARAEWQRRCTQTQMMSAGIEPLIMNAAGASHPAQMGFIISDVPALDPYKSSPVFYGYISGKSSELVGGGGIIHEPRAWALRTYAGPLVQIPSPETPNPKPEEDRGLEAIYNPSCFGCVLKPTRSVNPSFVHPMFMNKKLESINRRKLVESVENAASNGTGKSAGASSMEASSNGLTLEFFNSLMPVPSEPCPVCMKHDPGCPACWQVPVSEAEWRKMTARNGRIKSSLADSLHTKLCNRTLIDEHRAIQKDFLKVNVKTVPSGPINSFVIDKSDTVAHLYQMLKSVSGPIGIVEEIHLLLPTVNGFFYIDNVDNPGSDVRRSRYTCDMPLSQYNLVKGEEIALLNVSFMQPKQTAYMARKYLSLNILMKEHFDLERVVYEIDDLPKNIQEDDVQRSLNDLLQYSIEHAKEIALIDRYAMQKAQEEKLRQEFEMKRIAAIERRLLAAGGPKKKAVQHILPGYEGGKKAPLIKNMRGSGRPKNMFVKGEKKRGIQKPHVRVYFKKVFDVLKHPFTPRTFNVDVLPFDKIGHLRDLIKEEVGIEEENLFLYFKKKPLTDMDMRLVDCHIQIDNKIVLEAILKRTRREIAQDFVAKKTRFVSNTYQKVLPPERRQTIYQNALKPIALTKQGLRRGKRAYTDALDYYIRRTYGNMLGIELEDSDEDGDDDE
jgi:hypothetical protein